MKQEQHLKKQVLFNLYNKLRKITMMKKEINKELKEINEKKDN